jgi:tripartite-type tricarboxylate transporter receptor subunit TctC
LLLRAQAWSLRPLSLRSLPFPFGVKIIVPFPDGGINDVLPRILADKLAIKWSQPVVIENKTGVGGNIGAELAYQAEPDGYYGCARKCLESLSPCA